jgi:hypothetical protein
MSREIRITGVLLAVLVGAFACADLNAATSRGGESAVCAALQHYQATGVKILDAALQAAGPFTPAPGMPGMPPPPPIELPAHCLVSGVIDQRVGVAGKSYGMHFEIRLPNDWNQRFLFQGGGGTNGVVRPAIGSVKGPAALARGFAVVSQDAGHEGSDSSFGEDQQARMDMIYRSYERVTTVAKQLVAAYYGKGPQHSYFMGCSEGGREALLASQRMPLEYDGVVAGDPGFLLGVRFQADLDRLTLAKLAPKRPDGKPDYAKAFSPPDLQLLAAAITEECDAGDGLRDGLIDHWSGCQPKLAGLACKAEKTAQCLSAPQLAVIRKIFDGMEPLTPGFPFDTGVAQPGWQDKFAGGGRLGGGGVSSLQGFFLTPYDPTFDDEKLDWARDAPRFAEVGSLNRTDGVMYSSFKQHGGKLLLYTGLSDFAFSAKDLIAYYQRVAAANGGLDTTRSFARLFLVPGMTHCRGGQALDEFDPLDAVVSWVETGRPPDSLTATGKAFPGRARPLCPYPAETAYRGSGSIDEAANFSCRVPPAEGATH